MIYCDTSFLLPLYLPGDNWHRKATGYHRKHLAAEPFLFNPWHRWEMRHNIRSILLELRHQQIVFQRLQEDLDNGKLRHVAFNWTAVFDQADELSAAHTPEIQAGTVDYWHVAFALHAKAARFLTFDKAQLDLARRAGLNAPDLLRSGGKL